MLNLQSNSHIRVVYAQRFLPPFFWRRIPILRGKGINTIYGAWL